MPGKCCLKFKIDHFLLNLINYKKTLQPKMKYFSQKYLIYFFFFVFHVKKDSLRLSNILSINHWGHFLKTKWISFKILQSLDFQFLLPKSFTVHPSYRNRCTYLYSHFFDIDHFYYALFFSYFFSIINRSSSYTYQTPLFSISLSLSLFWKCIISLQVNYSSELFLVFFLL